jgi:hypothetical protein
VRKRWRGTNAELETLLRKPKRRRVRRCALCRRLRSRLFERENGQVICTDCKLLDRQLPLPGFEQHVA